MKSLRSLALSVLFFSVLFPAITGCQQQFVRLSKQEYLDKCKGAWAGQMIGVCYGAPYEFRSCGKPITKDLQPWSPERVSGVIRQDDLYVEMTFLESLEKFGPTITPEQAGNTWAQSKYRLAHANLYGRRNLQVGISPRMAGHPKYNRHADDIDFQIEADLFGIICPGMPRESNRLCDIYGHLMNYGDGVYGGMFVAGMYTAAYFESEDVSKVVQTGLACIPKGSLYHQCISDVVKWHAEHPDDWLKAWQKIEDKWNDGVDCVVIGPMNIDAKLNGAYIVMGLLYGQGDLIKTLEISTRCGQDADCNPSNAFGVLACMKGYKALGQMTAGIADIENTPFDHTKYSWNNLIPATQQMTERIIRRLGGQVTDDAYLIPLQRPKAAKLEQWTDQMKDLAIPIRQHEVNLWDSRWKVLHASHYMEPGYVYGRFDRDHLFMFHPSKDQPAVMVADLEVPKTDNPKLYIEVSSWLRGNFVLKVFVEDKLVIDRPIDTKGNFITVTADVSAYSGKTVKVRIEDHADGWNGEGAYFHTIEIK